MSRLRAARSATPKSVAHEGDGNLGAEGDRRRWPLRLGVLAVAAVGIGAPLAAAAAHDTEVSGQPSKKSDVGVPSTVLARSAQEGASALAHVAPTVPKAPPAVAVKVAPKPVVKPLVKVAPPTTHRKVTTTTTTHRSSPTTSEIRTLKRAIARHRVTSTTARKTYSAPSPPAVRRSRPSTSVASSSQGGSGVWDKIAACESGGDWNISTGNGFYGGLQFTQSSWHAVGGTGSPQGASRETQIEMGKRLQAQQGWGAWPVCSRKAGLR